MKTKEQKEYEQIIEEIAKRIFNRRTLKKGFSERELKALLNNDNFYEPETLWFTKEMIEVDIPRIIKIVKRET